MAAKLRNRKWVALVVLALVTGGVATFLGSIDVASGAVAPAFVQQVTAHGLNQASVGPGFRDVWHSEGSGAPGPSDRRRRG
jgi:hypothetical protein